MSPRERLEQLQGLIRAPADFVPTRLLLRLEYWYKSLEQPDYSLFSDEHKVIVPDASYDPNGKGRIHFFVIRLLQGVKGGKPELIESPSLWMRPFDKDWTRTVEDAFPRNGFRAPVVWDFNTPRIADSETLRPTEEGVVATLRDVSHKGAIRCGFEALRQGLGYDRDCLIAAFVDDRDALDRVKGLKEKCEAAKYKLKRVVVAENVVKVADNGSPPELTEDDIRNFADGKPPLEILRRGTLQQAIDEATGLPHALRCYLRHLEQLPDQDLPPYFQFKGRKFTGPDGLFIEPLG